MHGHPKILQTDNENKFIIEEVDELCKKNKILKNLVDLDTYKVKVKLKDSIRPCLDGYKKIFMNLIVRDGLKFWTPCLSI